MDPSPAERRAAEQYVSTAKNLLVAGNPDRSWWLLIQALCVDRDAPRANALLAAATALRAGQIKQRLPSGAPDPYAVFGLDSAVPTARDPAVIRSYYDRASDLLDRCHHRDPCWPAFANAARLVADAWAFLSDPDSKASLDSRFGGVATAGTPVPAASSNPEMLPPPPQPQPAPTPPPAQAAGPGDMGRGNRLKKRGRGERLKKRKRRNSCTHCFQSRDAAVAAAACTSCHSTGWAG